MAGLAGNRFGGGSYGGGMDALDHGRLRRRLMDVLDRREKRRQQQPFVRQPNGLGLNSANSFADRGPVGTIMSSRPYNADESAAHNERLRDRALYGGRWNDQKRGGLLGRQIETEGQTNLAKERRQQFLDNLKLRKVEEEERMGAFNRRFFDDPDKSKEKDFRGPSLVKQPVPPFVEDIKKVRSGLLGAGGGGSITVPGKGTFGLDRSGRITRPALPVPAAKTARSNLQKGAPGGGWKEYLDDPSPKATRKKRPEQDVDSWGAGGAGLRGGKTLWDDLKNWFDYARRHAF